jgi:hypothetical protein
MKTRIVLVSVIVCIALSGSLGSARAERLRVGGSFSVLPVGEIEASVGNQSASADTEMAAALGGVIEYQVGPNFAIGFTPRFIFRIKPEDAEESAEELDLLLRLIGNVPVGVNVELYGFAAPGYSVLYLPDVVGDVDDPAGFLFGLGGGVALDVNPQFRLAAELGYQFGGQEVEVAGQTLDVSTRFLHLGLVAMARF